MESWFDRQAEEAEARQRAREEIERWAQSPTPPNPRALVEETIQHAEAERQHVSADEKVRLARLADLLAFAGRRRAWEAQLPRPFNRTPRT